MKLESIRIEAKETDGYVLKSDGLYRNANAGQFLDRSKATRNAGNFKIFVDSFPNAALPYSTYYIASKKDGKVYTMQITHGSIEGALDKIVEELKKEA